MNQSKRSVHAIATIALCVVVVVLLVSVVAQRVAASRLAREIRVQQQSLTDARQNLENRRKWSRDYDELSLRLGGRMSACSWSDQMPYMMAQVNGIVQANGLKAENLQPEPMVATSNIRKFPMRVAVQTDLRRLTDVLKDVRNSSPLLDVERLEVRQPQDGDGGLQINMTVASFIVLDPHAPVARRRAATPVKKTLPKSQQAAALPQAIDRPSAAASRQTPAQGRSQPSSGPEGARSPTERVSRRNANATQPRPGESSGRTAERTGPPRAQQDGGGR